jgi:parallel beta-helix repeat protein
VATGLLFLAAFCCSSTVVGTADGAVLDQAQETWEGGGAHFWAERFLAQTFTPAISGQLDHLDLVIDAFGPGADPYYPATIAIVETVDGAPEGNVLGSVDLPGFAKGWNSIDFLREFVFLAAGTRYGIVLLNDDPDPTVTPTDGFGILWNTDPYPGGELWQWTLTSGWEWLDAAPPPGTGDSDGVFRTWMIPAPVTGACCLGEGICTSESQSACAGTYGGDHSACAGTDCNTNGVDDFCDILSGDSGDCNSNGTPDECDIGEGASKDCNSNGVPDECESGVPCVTNLTSGITYCTIQEAIDASVNGDTVLLSDGVYTGPGNNNVTFDGRAVTVRSEHGPDNCIIDCGHEDETIGFWFSAGDGPESVLDGLTITAGRSTLGGGAIDCTSASPTIRRCKLTDSRGAWGGAIRLERGAPTIEDCVMRGNTAAAPGPQSDAVGGAICGLRCSDLAVRYCTIAGNVAGDDGGGVYLHASSGEIVGCRIMDNTAGGNGAGLFMQNSLFRIADCLIAGNIAMDDGAGVYLYDQSSPDVSGCTITDNMAFGLGGAVLAFGWSLPTVSNSILYGNLALVAGNEIALLAGSELTVSYSDVDTGEGWSWIGPGCSLNWLEGNIETYPVFADPAGPDGDPYTFADNDYRLRYYSPCLDAGAPSFVPQPGETDLDGHVRVLCGRVDMGAYEFGIGDHDCNREIDLADFADWPPCLTGPDAGPYDPGCEAFDFESDGDVDVQDLAGFQAVFLPIPAGDLDGDGDVDLDDHGLFVDCLGGPGVGAPPAECPPEVFDKADLDGDDDADVADFAVFQQRLAS